MFRYSFSIFRRYPQSPRRTTVNQTDGRLRPRTGRKCRRVNRNGQRLGIRHNTRRSNANRLLPWKKPQPRSSRTDDARRAGHSCIRDDLYTTQWTHSPSDHNDTTTVAIEKTADQKKPTRRQQRRLCRTKTQVEEARFFENVAQQPIVRQSRCGMSRRT